MRLEDSPGEQLPAAVSEHLRACSACQDYEREMRSVRAALRALAEDSVPEVSTGFASRVVRQLGEPSRPARVAEQFWELVGRRAVLVGSLLVLAVAMALALPSSGPLRAPAPVDMSLAQSELAAENNPLLGGDLAGGRSNIPQQSTTGVREKQ